MATEKTVSYLSSVKEPSKEVDSLTYKSETQKALKLAIKKDYDGALEILNEIENNEAILLIKKCVELEDLFELFLNGDITLSHYKKSSKHYPDEAKDIVHYKYPNLEFIELKNLEKKFREKIEGIIDDLLSKNTLESLIEAKKVFEKNAGVVKKPYNFDKLFIKTISFIPYKDYAPLYDVEWTDVESLINNYLLSESNNFLKAETIIKEIKVIDKNRDTIQTIIRKFNKTFDARLRQNYREAKLKTFVREYNKHTFYALDKKNKVITKTEPFFLQRKIYATFYLNKNSDLFLGLLKANSDCFNVIPGESQKAYFYAIIRAVKKTQDYSIFEYIPQELINEDNFIEVIKNTLEEDEDTIRGIVKQLKGKDNQLILESLFLTAFKKELTFADTKKVPELNKEKADVLIEKYKENSNLVHNLKAKKIAYKTLAAFELMISSIFTFGIGGVSFFPFKERHYFLAVVILLVGLVLGIWAFVKLEEVITTNRERRLIIANKEISDLEAENIIILKKVYLGID